MICVFSGPCEAAREKADAGDEEPGLGAGDGSLEVLGEAAIASEPGERSFNDPAFGLGFKCADPFGSGHDLNCPSAKRGARVAQLLTAVDTVGKDVPQLGEAFPQRAEQRHRAVIVLDVGRMHQHGEQKALRIGNHVALAPSDPLGAIKPAWTAAFRGLGALAIDDPGRRDDIASQRRPSPPDERQIDPPPKALVAPEVEVVLHCGARRKALRQRTLLAAARQNIEDRVHHRPQVNFPRSPDAARRWQEKREQKPLRLRRVACINQVIAPIFFADDFSPSHCGLPSNLSKSEGITKG